MSEVTADRKIPGISFFCPAYHDALNLPLVIKKADRILSELCDDYEMIVINDGSPDSTGYVAEELSRRYHKLKVVHHVRNLGYAEALKTGFQTAARFDYILFTDGDNQYDIEYFKAMA
ncbi:MAG: glycosyltransferase family 2 protein, partial [Candidatus Omnitrophica bacterium]|nr:glycosyltransferase family 2 protein [Candidatus Omnitrophota bacterium]